MIYSTNNITESNFTNLRLDVIINDLKQTINKFLKNKKSEKLNVLSLINSEFEVLKNEINSPVDLQCCVKQTNNATKVSDEDIKTFLFSILSPSKLHIIRKWLSGKEEANSNKLYKADVILHFYKYSVDDEKLLTNQLSNMFNESLSCNLELDDLISLIKKAINNHFLEDKSEKSPIEVVINILEILKLNLFNLNSTRLYSHEPNELDENVKDYLFSLLSPEKLKGLKNWIINKDDFHKTTNFGIITSIYAPDY